LIENFKLDGLKKYGLDYDSLKEINPRLVYCSITGFGQTGPSAHKPGYDFIIQGMSGVMDLTGEPDGPPQKMGVAFADIFTGLYAVIGIQAALAHREKTGKGQQVDLSLLDSMVGVLGNQAMNYLLTGIAHSRLGNRHPNITPYQVFPTSDGWFILAVGNDAQFQRFCQVVDLTELADHDDFRHNADRVRNREKLEKLISARTSTFKRDDLLTKLEAHKIPVGPINNIAQAFDHEQIQARNMVIDFDKKTDGKPLKSVRTPLIFSDSDLQLDTASPVLNNSKAEWL